MAARPPRSVRRCKPETHRGDCGCGGGGGGMDGVAEGPVEYDDGGEHGDHAHHEATTMTQNKNN